jgi:hypothetical protein
MVTRKRSGSTLNETFAVFTPYRYVAKIIFTYILGYKVDVGHMEAVNLISSSKYSEKQIVSVYCSRVLSAKRPPSGLSGRNLTYARKLGFLEASGQLDP